MENNWGVSLKKLKLEHPAVPLLGIYQKKIKALTQKDTCTHVHWSIIYNSRDTEATLSIHWWMSG